MYCSGGMVVLRIRSHSFQFAIIIVIIVITITKVQVVYTNDQAVPNRVSPSPLPALVDSGYLLFYLLILSSPVSGAAHI